MRIGYLLLSPIIALIPLILIFSHSFSAQPEMATPLPANWAKIDPILKADLETQPDDHLFRVIVDLADRADLTAIARHASLQEKRFGTVALLQETAVSSQANLLQDIKTLSIQEEIE